MAKSRDAFRTISEVAEWLDTPAHVLRFWESKFSQVKPVKRAGGRRYYRPDDMMLLSGIKALLHEQGLTIKGAQKLLREKSVKYVAALGQDPEVDASGALVDAKTVDITPKTDAAPESKRTENAARPGRSEDTSTRAATEPAPATPPKLTINLGASAAKSKDIPGLESTMAGATEPEVVAPTQDGPAANDAANDDAKVDPVKAEGADTGEPTSAKVVLDSSRRTGRIPALPTNPGAFARPGPLTSLLRAPARVTAAKSERLAPVAARLRAKADSMKASAP